MEKGAGEEEDKRESDVKEAGERRLRGEEEERRAREAREASGEKNTG